LRVDALVEIAQAVQTAVTRLAHGLRGEATLRPGRTRKDIADLTRLEVVGLREGSTVLAFDLAERERPLDELDLGVAALESFEAGIVCVASGEVPPEPWDEGVLQAVRQLTHVLDKDIDEIAVGSSGARPEQRAILTRSTRVEPLTAVSPVAWGQVEIEGRLLMADFAATRDEARIHRPLEPPIRCTFGPDLETAVLHLLRRYVRARGRAELDDQGRIRRLELESLEDAELASGRAFWDLATLEELAAEQGVEVVQRLEDLVDGTWPEDESVDEFLAAIESRG
jgi:hypothetical protein